MNESLSSDDWQPCPPGMLESVPDRLRQLDRRRWLMSAGMTTVGVVGACAGISLIANRGSATMQCQEVIALRSIYFQKQLSSEQIKSIETHLLKCYSCRTYYLQIRSQTNQNPPKVT